MSVDVLICMDFQECHEGVCKLVNGWIREEFNFHGFKLLKEWSESDWNGGNESWGVHSLVGSFTYMDVDDLIFFLSKYVPWNEKWNVQVLTHEEHEVGFSSHRLLTKAEVVELESPEEPLTGIEHYEAIDRTYGPSAIYTHCRNWYEAQAEAERLLGLYPNPVKITVERGDIDPELKKFHDKWAANEWAGIQAEARTTAPIFSKAIHISDSTNQCHHEP